MSVEAPQKTLHSKRPLRKYPKIVDLPAYDAPEEDNDPLTDDRVSGASIPLSVPRHTTATESCSAHPKPSATTRAKHRQASSLALDSDGVDLPTSTTHAEPINSNRSPQSAATFVFPAPSATTTLAAKVRADPMQTIHPAIISQPANLSRRAHSPCSPKVAFDPAALTPEDIQAFVQNAINGESWRKYKINPPPIGRPIRIYADGVYDLLHFGHTLHLRQAKLSFPSVYLLAGVHSDEIVKTYKGGSIMTHAERLEVIRHCRWVDEVVADAPWVIDKAFLDKWEIDYVAHDEEPYATAEHADTFALPKSQGRFLPTRRTPGVSTSDLFERIISGYRKCHFDEVLVKMGRAELKAGGSNYYDRSPNGS
ncbi:hypothetical protein BD779DRAFT_1613719 [Infundibulicybe gibba]|nr:hypothetical protein BD779DRAFT_1613719 [Infundibulicybe gibba]